MKREMSCKDESSSLFPEVRQLILAILDPALFFFIIKMERGGCLPWLSMGRADDNKKKEGSSEERDSCWSHRREPRWVTESRLSPVGEQLVVA